MGGSILQWSLCPPLVATRDNNRASRWPGDVCQICSCGCFSRAVGTPSLPWGWVWQRVCIGWLLWGTCWAMSTEGQGDLPWLLLLACWVQPSLYCTYSMCGVHGKKSLKESVMKVEHVPRTTFAALCCLPHHLSIHDRYVGWSWNLG